MRGAERAAGAPDLTFGSVAGVWNASVSGQSCQVATPQTKLARLPRRSAALPGTIDGVKSWNVAGKQLTLYDENGGAAGAALFVRPGKIRRPDPTGLPIRSTARASSFR